MRSPKGIATTELEMTPPKDFTITFEDVHLGQQPPNPFETPSISETTTTSEDIDDPSKDMPELPSLLTMSAYILGALLTSSLLLFAIAAIPPRYDWHNNTAQMTLRSFAIVTLVSVAYISTLCALLVVASWCVVGIKTLNRRFGLDGFAIPVAIIAGGVVGVVWVVLVSWCWWGVAWVEMVWWGYVCVVGGCGFVACVGRCFWAWKRMKGKVGNGYVV